VAIAANPCGDPDPYEMGFAEYVPGSYDRLASGYGTTGVAVLEAESGECFDLFEIGPGNHPFLGTQAFEVAEPMILPFLNEDVYEVTVYLGAMTSDPERLPCLECVLADGINSARWCATTPYEPGEYRRLGGGILSGEPIVSCMIEPDGAGVFGGLLQTSGAVPAAKQSRKQPTPTRRTP
jgi:hypothetical protein